MWLTPSFSQRILVSTAWAWACDSMGGLSRTLSVSSIKGYECARSRRSSIEDGSLCFSSVGGEGCSFGAVDGEVMGAFLPGCSSGDSSSSL